MKSEPQKDKNGATIKRVRGSRKRLICLKILLVVYWVKKIGKNSSHKALIKHFFAYSN